MTMRRKLALMFFAYMIIAHVSRPIAAQESRETTISGEAAQEFFFGMFPPLRRGDWAMFEENGKKTRVTVVTVEGAGTAQKATLAFLTISASGKISDGGKQETVLSEAARELMERYDSFVVAPKTVEVKGETINAATVKAFRDGKVENEFTISSEVPLGEVIRHGYGSNAILIDYGWGEDPKASRLSFEEAAARIGAALPEPKEGEWCELLAPGLDTGVIEKHHLTIGVDGNTGGRMLALYGVDAKGSFFSLERWGEEELRKRFEPFAANAEYCTILHDTITVNDTELPVLTLNLFYKGVAAGRFHFSAELPFPWLAKGFLLAPPDGLNSLLLLDWGREETPEITRRERIATVDDAITAIIDAGLANAAVGDWVLYEKMGGGTLRFELTGIEGSGENAAYTLLFQEKDAAGKILSEDRKRNTYQEMIDGVLPTGDIRADRFDIARAEAVVNGETIPLTSITGYNGDELRYRIDLSKDVPVTTLSGLVLFDVSSEPFMRLVESGRK